jgi:hypothetical protein
MTAAARGRSPSTSWAPRAHGRGRGDDGEAVREHREAQDVADARSEMPRQDSQVTVDRGLRWPPASLPHARMDSAGTRGSLGLDRCVSLLSTSGLDESD